MRYATLSSLQKYQDSSKSSEIDNTPLQEIMKFSIIVALFAAAAFAVPDHTTTTTKGLLGKTTAAAKATGLAGHAHNMRRQLPKGKGKSSSTSTSATAKSTGMTGNMPGMTHSGAGMGKMPGMSHGRMIMRRQAPKAPTPGAKATTTTSSAASAKTSGAKGAKAPAYGSPKAGAGHSHGSV